MSTFPTRAYFQISNMGKFGLVIREVSVCEAGDIEKAALSIDDDTVSFHLIEDGKITDASEDVAAAWMKAHGETVEFDGDNEPLVSAFIQKHCKEQLDEMYGEIETARADHYSAQRDYYAGLGV
jgi:hypothetical protein